MPDWLQGITGSLSFIAISVLALLGLGQLMVMLGKPAWQAMNGNLNPPFLPPWSRPEGFIRFWIIRTAIAAAVGLLAGLAVFLWPRMLPGRWRQGLAAACIVLAAVMAAHPPRPFPLLPILLGCLLVFGSTSLSACLGRGRRWPASLIAVASGFTIGIGWIHLPSPGTPMWLTLLWALDAFPVVASWLVAYLFGIRKLRVWAESSDR